MYERDFKPVVNVENCIFVKEKNHHSFGSLNTYFSFKQFTVHQDKCAMKVCTDACLFGAWVAEKMESKKMNAAHVLDIGTGTGLLSLMLAQKITANITALDIDADASMQAAENFGKSPWKERLTAVHENVLDYTPDKKFELIISNPPFYEADLRSADNKKNAAKHDSTLTLKALLQVIHKLLSNEGKAAILIPGHRTSETEKWIAEEGFFIEERCFVQQTPAHQYFRTMFLLSAKAVEKKEENIVITNPDRTYTTAFTNLLKDYYLKL